MIVKLLTEYHLEFLSLKGGCTGSSESTLVKMSNCWKSHALAQFIYGLRNGDISFRLLLISLFSCLQELVSVCFFIELLVSFWTVSTMLDITRVCTLPVDVGLSLSCSLMLFSLYCFL